MKILAQLDKLEFLDLTNNPITQHPLYFEFVVLFNEKLSTLDREVIQLEEKVQVLEESSFIGEMLEMFAQNYLKIIAFNSVIKKRKIGRELADIFQSGDVIVEE